MNLIHFLIIVILAVISLIAITIYIIIPVQPVTAKIIGYSMTICDPNLNNSGMTGCMSTMPTIVGNNSFAIHVGDKFRLYVMVTNPNFFTGNFDSASTTFDNNAVEYHYGGCACCGAAYVFGSFESTEIIVPTSCADDITNSTGETNATVQIQYHINGKRYNVSTSQIITILPKTGN